MSEYPLIRLDPNQSRLWWLNQGGRQLIARVFARRYGTCIVLTDDCLAVGKVDARGGIELARAPYHRHQMWEVHNKPVLAECHCADFIDPEIGGPWRNRNSERHHPMCIYDRPAAAVFGHFARLNQAPSNVVVEELKRQRPDAWVRARAEMEGASVSTLAVK